MDTEDVVEARRFELPVRRQEEIQAYAKEHLGTVFHALFPRPDNWEWMVCLTPIDDLEYDDSILPSNDAAALERDRAVSWARLKVGESHPIITMGRDHKILYGAEKLELLKDLEEDHALVYHARNDDE